MLFRYVNCYSINMIRRNKLITAVLLAEFLIYAISPIVSPLNHYSSSKPNIKSIYIFELISRLFVEDDNNNDQTVDDKLLIKKKRVVTRKFDDIVAKKAVRFTEGLLDSLVFSKPPNIATVSADIKINKHSFKGFFPLFSGSSPPLA